MNCNKRNHYGQWEVFLFLFFILIIFILILLKFAVFAKIKTWEWGWKSSKVHGCMKRMSIIEDREGMTKCQGRGT